jgi:hypothetical protein
MDLNISEMLAEIQRELNENGTDVVLQWNTLSSGTLPDPVDGSTSGLVPQSMTLRAFAHAVQATGSSSVRQFNEVEVGDLILDFEGDAKIDGLRDLVFVVNGKAYVAKEIGEKLAQSWDVTVGNQRLFRSVLVRVAT